MNQASSPAAPKKRGHFALLLCLLAVAGAVWFFFIRSKGGDTGREGEAQPVRVATAKKIDVPQYLQGLGTVTPANTVLVRSRVDGHLVSLHFEEGQKVAVGDLLAQIDPRPYEVQLAQAEGALARDEALLKNARLDLDRFRKLNKEGSVSIQQLQSQESLVGQYEGAVQVDEAGVADAKLQLTYCRITAPVAGRIGLKRVDLGNMIRASDTTGIAVITQVQPMYVVFTLVEKQIPNVREAMHTNPGKLVVEAWDQEGKKLLATGSLLTLDNQIDTSTGTIKAKAHFDNADESLFPNQFVSARLLVRTLKDALTIPVSAMQRSNTGAFVFTVNATSQAHMQPIASSYSTADTAVIEEGLAPGDVVVTDGVDRLREGSKVRFGGNATRKSGPPSSAP